jgi:ATP-dependent RNA helicase DeaD
VSDSPFAALGLRPELVAALTRLGYEEPTPIQREAVPLLLAGRDLLGQAATGTGKTAAFALPALQSLVPDADSPQVLVLVPTRELAMQVSEAVHRYGRELGARVVPVYGGQPIGAQLRALDRGADVVVATPGRAVDHVRRGTLRLESLRCLVLDEADEMLDMGFAADIDALVSETPTSRQTVLFSATLPPRVQQVARHHLRDPAQIALGSAPPASEGAPAVRQRAYVVSRGYKAATLGRVLDVESPGATLVFCRTRDEVDQLAETLNGRGYRAEPLHGGMGQEQRDRVMARLRAGTADLVVATDVAARGLDVEQLTHVVNYDVPSSPDTYVHRVGRVGRAGRQGVAVTLVEPREHRMLKLMERATGGRIEVEKVPTVADLRARRLEGLQARVREAAMDRDDLDHYRVVLESLADELDPIEVALGALRLVDEASGAADEVEIPEWSPERQRARSGPDGGRPETGGRPDGGRPETGGRPDGGRPGTGGGGRSGTGGRDPGLPWERRGGGDGTKDGGRGPRDGRSERDAGLTVRLFVGLGREAGLRPADLVGAITGETDLTGRQVGAIDIGDRFALVDVPAEAAEQVIVALRATTLKGRRPYVRRERPEGAKREGRKGRPPVGGARRLR